MAETTLETSTPTPSAEPAAPVRASRIRQILDVIAIPVLAVFTALVVSGFLIAFSDEKVLAALPQATQHPLTLLSTTWKAVSVAYGALLTGSFGSPTAIIAGAQKWASTGSST